MSDATWKTISRETVIANPWWSYRKDTVELPDGSRGEYHIVHTEGASMVIPLLETGEVVLVSQYRYLGGRRSLDFPCGGVKPGRTYEQTASEELAEEAGYAADTMTEIGSFNPFNGVTDEVCRVYLARGLRPVNAAPDPTEDCAPHLMLPAELERRIRSGEIWDGMTLAAWVLSRPLSIKGG